MPSRPVTVGILVFWLVTTAAFVARDVLPYWLTDTPPVRIALADEAIRQVVPVRWQIIRDGQTVGTLATSLRFHEADDTYEFTAHCPELSLLDATLPLVGRLLVTARNYNDSVRVTRDGELRSMQTRIELAVRTGASPEIVGVAELAAENRNGRLQRSFKLASPAFGEFAPELEPAEPIRGSVLNPLHPIHRLSGVYPGQRWRQPLILPHEEIVRAALAQLPGAESAATALGDTGPRWLNASVRADPERLPGNRNAVECLVIDYRGDWRGEEFIARTWIRRSDGDVLRQEAESQGHTLLLIRE